MNEITIHGNIVSDPELRIVREGTAMLTFRMALPRRRYDRDKGGWVTMPSWFQNVVAFNGLAGNAEKTLAKGMTVTVTGELVDNSYTPTGADYTVARSQVLAADIAVSLRWATAQVTRNPRPGQTTEPSGTTSTTEPNGTADRPADPAGPVEQATTTKATKAAKSTRTSKSTRTAKTTQPQPA